MTETIEVPSEAAAAAERIEAFAWADWYAAAPPDVRARCGQRASHLAGATLLIAPGLPVPLFNRVIGLGLDRPATEDDLSAIRDAYREAGVGKWVLQLIPRAAPPDLQERARAAGFGAPSSRWAKMWRGGGAVPAVDTDLSVDEVVGDEAAAAWAEAVAAGYEMPALAPWLRALHARPGWRLYRVSEDGRAVGGGALFGDGEHAWLGMGAMRPSHRGRRGQAAVMARRVADAIAAGAKWIFTETGEPADGARSPSLDNMRRCGFVPAASRVNLPAPEG